MVHDKSIQFYADDFLEKRNDKSFSELYNRLHKGLYNYICKLCNTPYTIGLEDDILSNTFLKMLTHISTYKEKNAMFSTWIYSIAHNEVIDEMRKNKKKVSLDKMCEQTEVSDVDYLCTDIFLDKESLIINVEDNLTLIENQKKVREIVVLICWEMNNLDDLYKDILVDRIVHDMKYESISKKYNLNINTVKSRIRIGKSIIKNSLDNDIQKLKKEV